MTEPTPPAPPLRVAIVGTARRSDYLYGPLIRALPERVTLVSVWGRSEASARRLGESLGVPHYTDLERLVRETEPVIGVVSVAYGANGEVGLMAVEHGLHVLLETPIAHPLHEADAILEAAAVRGLEVEVSEQFHRRPMEAIKLRLLSSGLFGEVHSSFSDFAGHGYHGVSVMRSYLGFERPALSVTGLVRDYDLAPHWSRLADSRGPRRETQEHALVAFEGGKLGVYHWTSVGYDSPLRPWRSSRFLAEKGMGVSLERDTQVEHRLSLLAAGGEAPRTVVVERRYERNDGGALVAVLAHTGDAERPIVRWDNPFLTERKGHNLQWHDDEIAVASCLTSLVDAVRSGGEPSYGGEQARLDQEIVLAMRRSSEGGGAPVALPLPRGDATGNATGDR